MDIGVRLVAVHEMKEKADKLLEHRLVQTLKTPRPSLNIQTGSRPSKGGREGGGDVKYERNRNGIPHCKAGP